MADEGPCFGFKKKTVVMTCIGLCCLALVMWTIWVTSSGAKEEKQSEVEEKEGSEGTNGTVFKEICPLNTSIPLHKLEIAVPVNQSSATLVKLKPILRRTTKETMCKCLCENSVRDVDILRAVSKPGNRKPTPKPGNTDAQYVLHLDLSETQERMDFPLFL